MPHLPPQSRVEVSLSPLTTLISVPVFSLPRNPWFALPAAPPSPTRPPPSPPVSLSFSPTVIPDIPSASSSGEAHRLELRRLRAPVKPVEPRSGPSTPAPSSDSVNLVAPANLLAACRPPRLPDPAQVGCPSPSQFVEIVADPSLEANKLRLLLYNGSTGKVYKSWLLADSQAFTVSNSLSGFLIYTAFLPLQNGPCDGIALVSIGNDDQLEVIQLLSYEGTFKANDGPARGIESVDVNIRETEASSEHDSLGLTGTSRREFMWKKFKGTATPGKSNIGQKF